MPCNSRCKSNARLDGKTIIITGSNSGIGKETVRDFYKRGGRVIMACRSLDKARESKEDLLKTTESLGKPENLGEIVVMKLDLNSLASVREFAKEVLEKESQISILVNNAGVMTTPEGKTADGFETQFGTNHLGHFLLTLLLLPRIIKSAPARIVTVSSVGHRSGKIDLVDPNYEKKPYSAWSAYGQSKLANVMFSKELSKRLREKGISNVNTYCLHPGGIQTDLGRHLDDVYFKGAGWLNKNIMSHFLKTPEQGAQTSIYCAVDEACENESGLYYEECKLNTPSKKSQDEEMCSQLWELSEKLVKLGDFDPFVSK